MAKVNAIKIRPYRKQDATALKHGLESILDHFSAIDPAKKYKRRPGYGDYVTKDFLKEIKAQQGKIFVAVDGKQVVGFIGGAIYKTRDWYRLQNIPTKTGWILQIFVEPDYRNLGLNNKLQNVMEDYFRKKNCDLIRVEGVGPQAKVQPYYQKRDFYVWSMDMIKILK